MTAHPDATRRGRLFALSVGLLWLVSPVFADEALEEDFLLLLSEWADDAGEFVAPTELEQILESGEPMSGAAAAMAPGELPRGAEGGSDEQDKP
ncbi:hypothetical protein [Microbulbifer pacificus]|uniref:hypothetical protein n=1 Tax=Microbulbifer pacificus TaxID=407164 RepID=UPI000CF4F5F6|nr:hypothetical protein [Microbulbifer pacificus]